MSDEKQSAAKRLSLKELDARSINQLLRSTDWQTGDEAEIVGADRQHAIASGLSQSIKLIIHGALGDYSFALNDGCDCEVVGDVGLACGHSLRSGSILVRGHAGPSLAAFSTGGFVAVHWSAGPRCGLFADGVEIVVRSDVGGQAGWGMRSGTLVIGSDAAPGLGTGMTGGTVFIRGKAPSVASHLRESRMKDADSLRLGLLLVRAGIRAEPKEFRVLRVRT